MDAPPPAAPVTAQWEAPIADALARQHWQVAWNLLLDATLPAPLPLLAL